MISKSQRTPKNAFVAHFVLYPGHFFKFLILIFVQVIVFFPYPEHYFNFIRKLGTKENGKC